MKYICVLALAAMLGIVTANPTAAQDRGRSDGEVVVRDRGDGRGESGNGRGRSNDGEKRGRSQTGDVDRERSGRTLDDILNGRRSGENDDRRDRRRGDDDDDWDERRRGDDDWDDDDWDDDDYRDRRDRRDRRGGPAFCRSGAGHPVFGREWCRDKGFGVGGRYDDDDVWERRRVDDIFFPSRRSDRYMSGSVLEHILGDVFYGRLGSYARSLRADGPIRGRWNGDSELRIYADGTPFARLVDLNDDRRADVIYLRK